jgi:hypothetical protein
MTNAVLIDFASQNQLKQRSFKTFFRRYRRRNTFYTTSGLVKQPHQTFFCNAFSLILLRKVSEKGVAESFICIQPLNFRVEKHFSQMQKDHDGYLGIE